MVKLKQISARIVPAVPVLSALVMLAVLVWLASEALAWLGSLNPTVAAAVTTATLGLLGLWYVQWQSKTRDIAESHRDNKIQVYSTFFDIVEKVTTGGETAPQGETEISEEMRRDFAKLNRGLLLWASPGVINAWLQFRRASSASGDILPAVDQMYQAIRKDLGNSNFGLKKGDLIRIALKDVDELKP